MSVLLALDPGVSTGWSFWHYDATTPLRHIDHGTIPHGLRGFLGWLSDTHGGEPDEIVAEDFILDGRTARPDTTPLEILGALELFAHTTETPLVRQRNVMKAHAPDQLLKDKGLWWPGKGHDRDSARHAIAFMKTRRHAPTLRWLYGKGVA